MHNRLRTQKENRLRKTGRPLTQAERERYGKSKQIRYVAGSQEPIYPIGYVQHKNPIAKRRNAAISLAKAHGTKPVGVRVVMGGVIVCQYLMDGKDSDEWLERKQRTVERSAHSSLWVRVRNDATHEYDAWREEGCAICGVGAIHLATKELRVFEKCTVGFGLGDFYIDCNFKDQEHNPCWVDLLIFYCPIRYEIA